MQKIDISELPELKIEYNLLRDLDSKEIGEIREKVVEEVDRIMEWSQVVDTQEHLPFGEKIIEEKEEQTPRFEAMKKQMIVSLRYLEAMLDLDKEICGQEERQELGDVESKKQRTSGVKMPVLRVEHRGRRATIFTRNTWGSVDYNDASLQDELKEVLTERCGHDDEHFEHVLEEYLRRESGEEIDPDRSYDVQVLKEDDRVEIYNAKNEYVGSATVMESIGNVVRLHVGGSVRRIRKDFHIRKKSNRRALETYKQYLLDFCTRLGILHQMTDRNGEKFVDDAESLQREYHGKVTTVEKTFFGIGDDLDDVVRENAQARYFAGEDIPRGLLADTEQSAAFGLCARGHPCTLVQGPPGTGKTFVIGHLASHFNGIGLKTLIVSHSNRGLDVSLFNIKDKRKKKVYRGGSEIGVCKNKALHEDFIRKDLKIPQRHDFLFETFDHEAYERAVADLTDDDPRPRKDGFVKLEVDEDSLRAAWKAFEKKKERIYKRLKREEGLIAGVTLNSLISDDIIQALDFDVVIVDEATIGYIYEILPALLKAGKQIIFVGDHKQLKNIPLPEHISNHLKDLPEELRDHGDPVISAQDVANFESGPFAFMAERTSIPQVMLRTNRRSLPGIVEMVSLSRYDGRLKAGKYDENNPSNPGKLTWVDTAARADRFETPVGVSKANQLEARIIARRLAREYARGELDEDNFGVISMYSAERDEVRRMSQKHPFNYHQHREEILKLLHGNNGTVDSFQGSEREKIILSLTRSNEDEVVGHTKDVDRANVACSRAQSEFTIVGDSSTIIDGNPDEECRRFYQIVRECIERHGEVITEFSDVATEAMPEKAKSQTHSSKRRRYRNALKKKWAAKA